MPSCILGQSIEAGNTRLHDLRSFFSDVQDIVHHTCGMARQALISIYGHHKTWKTDFDELFSLICKSRNEQRPEFPHGRALIETITEKVLNSIFHTDDKAPDGPLQHNGTVLNLESRESNVEHPNVIQITIAMKHETLF